MTDPTEPPPGLVVRVSPGRKQGVGYRAAGTIGGDDVEILYETHGPRWILGFVCIVIGLFLAGASDMNRQVVLPIALGLALAAVFFIVSAMRKEREAQRIFVSGGKVVVGAKARVSHDATSIDRVAVEEKKGPGGEARFDVVARVAGDDTSMGTFPSREHAEYAKTALRLALGLPPPGLRVETLTEDQDEDETADEDETEDEDEDEDEAEDEDETEDESDQEAAEKERRGRSL